MTSVLRDVRVPFRSDLRFDVAFDSRRTRRVFDPVPLRETRGFVQHVFSAQSLGRKQQEGRIRKAYISSGALHPVDVIILAGPEVQEPILFDDVRRKFCTLPILDPSSLCDAVKAAKFIQPTANGHLFLLVGDARRISATYFSAESLLWRDAGAALQACSIAAHAYGYAFCPLGHTGKAALSALGPPHEDFIALGMAMFGK